MKLTTVLHGVRYLWPAANDAYLAGEQVCAGIDPAVPGARHGVSAVRLEKPGCRPEAVQPPQQVVAVPRPRFAARRLCSTYHNVQLISSVRRGIALSTL